MHLILLQKNRHNAKMLVAVFLILSDSLTHAVFYKIKYFFFPRLHQLLFQIGFQLGELQVRVKLV